MGVFRNENAAALPFGSASNRENALETPHELREFEYGYSMRFRAAHRGLTRNFDIYRRPQEQYLANE